MSKLSDNEEFISSSSSLVPRPSDRIARARTRLKMGRILRSCLQSILKMVNSVGGLVGVAFILYGLWMMRIWYREFHSDPTLPWFIYTSLGLGVSLCLITCFGHIATETSNGHCITFATILIKPFNLIDCIITVHGFNLIACYVGGCNNCRYNSEQRLGGGTCIMIDFPDDTTGRFNEFKNFIRSNLELCQWVGLTIVTAQGMSIFLAMILKALSPNSGSSYDSDDDSMNARLPLLRNQVQQGATYVCDPHVPYKSDSWNLR
ncbi:hypothetical protein ZIOFF_040025 [Zingiber officinale]|uniref:Uncharacterized protein n=1 Tax=Zingiber officinale TaxID=94328 RepID=A0A8J5KXM6_ZINOF|nr:hypothetical protein ZIOFF_040025 [Zingiber officinale]